jgi:hypothetical protein
MRSFWTVLFLKMHRPSCVDDPGQYLSLVFVLREVRVDLGCEEKIFSPVNAWHS